MLLRRNLAWDQLFLAECLPLNAEAVIPTTLHHPAGIPRYNHPRPTVLGLDFITDQKDLTDCVIFLPLKVVLLLLIL